MFESHICIKCIFFQIKKANKKPNASVHHKKHNDLQEYIKKKRVQAQRKWAEEKRKAFIVNLLSNKELKESAVNRESSKIAHHKRGNCGQVTQKTGHVGKRK